MSKASKQRRRQLRAQTSPANPAHSAGSTVLILPRSIAGIRVTEQNALTFSPVWACVKVISEDLAALPWRVYRKRPNGGRDLIDSHVVDWLLHVQSNPETSAFSFRETMLAHALTWGNGYAEIERDGAGRPVWMHQLTPDRVQVARTQRGRLVYDVWNGGGESNTALEAEDVFHLKGPSHDGIVGYNLVSLASKTIGLGLALREYGSHFFGNDATPSGILKSKKTLTDTAKGNIESSWRRKFAGPHKAGGVAVLEEDMDFVKISVDNEQSQYHQTMQTLAPEICRFWRVPPHKIADLTRSTFSNIEHQALEYVGDCLMPWAVRLEQEANVKLFGQVQSGTYYTRHNFAGRLRGDAASRASYFNTMHQNGFINADEVREAEEMNPIPGGDVYLINGNMMPRTEAAEPPEPKPEPPPVNPTPPPTTPAGEDEPQEAPAKPSEGKSDLAGAARPVLLAACRRVLTREKHRFPESQRRGNDCLDEQRRFADKELSAPIETLCILLGRPELAGAVLAAWSEDYGHDLKERWQGNQVTDSLTMKEAEWEQLAGWYAVQVGKIAACAATAEYSAPIEGNTNGHQATVTV